MQIAILGCGTMGRALGAGLASSAHARRLDFTLFDRVPAAAAAMAERTAGRVAPTLADAVADADVVLLCVKPNDVAGLLAGIANHRARNASRGLPVRRQVLISIAAGVTLADIERYFVANAADDGGLSVIRAMPNTACAAGYGMTVLAYGAGVTADEVACTREMFERTGRVLELDERHFAAVTALSASGPAFIYLVLEALVDGGLRCGLPRRHALDLAAQMARGAASLVLDSGAHPAVLRDEVTTPGGCTVEGLAALEEGAVRSTIARAVEVTARRASQLGAPSAGTVAATEVGAASANGAAAR
ncbi:MAG: pyrroline-5-carboxylate reductase [Gemmatimonadaceae bacterium]